MTSQSLTICIPVRNPDSAALEWIQRVCSDIAGRSLPVNILISAHTTNITFEKANLPGATSLTSKDELTYDQNVAKLAEHVQTRFLLIAGVGDHFDLDGLERLTQFLSHSCANVGVVVLAPPNVSEGFSCIRFGFLGTFVFCASFMRDAVRQRTDYGGWIHTGIFLTAVRRFQNIAYFTPEIVLEDLPKGFKKGWVANGNFINYQVALAKLAEELIPDHPLYSIIKVQALGNWPFDIMRTWRYRNNFSSETRRYVSMWLKQTIRGYGIIKLLLLAMRQTITAIVQRYG